MVSLFGRGFKSRQLHLMRDLNLFRIYDLGPASSTKKISTDCQWIFFI